MFRYFILMIDRITLLVEGRRKQAWKLWFSNDFNLFRNFFCSHSKVFELKNCFHQIFFVVSFFLPYEEVFYCSTSKIQSKSISSLEKTVLKSSKSRKIFLKFVIQNFAHRKSSRKILSFSKNYESLIQFFF